MTQGDFEALSSSKAKIKSSKGKAIILCLDKSGSMSGTPYEALKQGCLELGKTLFSGDLFEHIVICLYESYVNASVHVKEETYAQVLRGSYAGGGTNFVVVNDYIEKFVQENQVSDLSVIFFTDGEDGCPREELNASMEKLRNYLIKKELVCRFLTIGFTSSHDA